MLGEIAHLDAGAEADAAIIRLGGASDEFQQRRLAGAVHAHHAPALPAAHLEVEALVDAATAIALVHVPERDHVLARARGGRKIEQHGLPALGRIHPVDFLQLFHPALHLCCMRGARLEALDELDLLGQHRLLALEGRLLLALVQGALLLIEFVVARIAVELAAVDFDDLGDDAVHEFAVMRGHHQHALVVLQELFEPDQALEIEVVRGLVEQHGVRLHQQDAGQRHAHLPAA